MKYVSSQKSSYDWSAEAIHHFWFLGLVYFEQRRETQLLSFNFSPFPWLGYLKVLLEFITAVGGGVYEYVCDLETRNAITSRRC